MRSEQTISRYFLIISRKIRINFVLHKPVKRGRAYEAAITAVCAKLGKRVCGKWSVCCVTPYFLRFSCGLFVKIRR